MVQCVPRVFVVIVSFVVLALPFCLGPFGPWLCLWLCLWLCRWLFPSPVA